jgi:hypothetical protein
MKINSRRIIRTDLVWIILILPFIGCASLSRTSQEGVADEPQQVSSTDDKSTTQALPEEVKPTTPEAEPAQQQSKYLVHKVRWPGETLSVISQWYTGKARNWKILAETNPKLNPNRIFRGNEILIPDDLLKKREPMPKRFVDRFAQKSKKKISTSRPSPTPNEEEDLTLFGPKGMPE